MTTLKSRNSIWIVIFWLIFTITLAGWWVWFAYDLLAGIQSDVVAFSAERIERKQRMLISEGIVMIILLLGGGGALAYYLLREEKRNRQIQQFFAAFSHELKTPIASLRLQAESLEEDLAEVSGAQLARRLVRDSVRLEYQLENSLLLANVADLQRFQTEKFLLSELVDSLKRSWPEMVISLTGESRLTTDRRILLVVLRNLLYNAIVHGKATEFRIQVLRSSKGNVELEVQDNGPGFQGEFQRLGIPFIRHAATSGSGIGLYLVKELTKKLGGDVTLPKQAQAGFPIRLLVPGEIL